MVSSFIRQWALYSSRSVFATVSFLRGNTPSVWRRGLDFKRIQFTPDLMPADTTGSEIIKEDVTTHRQERRFMEGPIFTNFLLADEINRTPPKTQAALLEAMQERTRHAPGARRST